MTLQANVCALLNALLRPKPTFSWATHSPSQKIQVYKYELSSFERHTNIFLLQYITILLGIALTLPNITQIYIKPKLSIGFNTSLT